MASTPATTYTASDDREYRSDGGRVAHGYRNQLPTRVSNACERCRRNKSRCDPFRPCSLCVRANVECSSGSVNNSSRPRKRQRVRDPPVDRFQPSHPTLPGGASSRHSFSPEEQVAITNNSSFPLGTSREVATDADSRRQSVDYGEADSAMGIARKICRLSSQDIEKRTISAIPGGDICVNPPIARQDRNQRRLISSILGYSLPSTDVMHTLLEEYFDAVHWFSLVVYEPKFRTRFRAIEDGLAYPSQTSFLILLSTMLGMGAWYRSQRKGIDTDHPGENWRECGLSLIKSAGSHLTDLMDQSSVTSVQTCILLGSYYVYHGRPNLSFALLGATIKTAQAIGLHREPLRGAFEDSEERKRVWWTIYTWDRFASVTYGRPLGINDKDCNVTTPTDVYESPCFKESSPPRDDCLICYSTYQRELNRLYLIASPIIETIFGIRTVGSVKQVAGNLYTTLFMEVTERLWDWRQRLPPHLLLDFDRDCQPDPSAASRVHRLQALALQLTFDNLLIIIHRPFLAQQVDHLFKRQPENGQGTAHPSLDPSYAAYSSPPYVTNTNSPHPSPQMSSSEQWWNAAVRTSRVTEMPQLAQLATDSHLVAFLAINLFNSAIVMVVMALSDPLSNRAQEVKRTITRIFRLQELLGKRSTLSMQSSIVLKDVIHMLLRREADAMLAPVVSLKRCTAGTADEMSIPSPVAPMSVEDTLRLPLHLPLNSTLPEDQQHITADRILRLNESLASVQRVFPVGFDGFQDYNGAGSGGWEQAVPNHMSQIGDGMWSHTGFHNFGADNEVGPTNEEGSVGATGNGLYWFWDSIWSETPR
ncbi:hypothetical protein K469DRAFT_751583 [Zopfia rhizophila CBS 207.26]|uniref:Zn(2)-C6 fungal-type domain-containing protein n=1 Tax=Zopfia rhizophila CBS 207.26 TaxID=1314779 RepID=A0A6A6DYM5_9PEZI|nr:hypothetical protein K469DRAFT_751583 [Zopfia rhizophila CBS 207.26]